MRTEKRTAATILAALMTFTIMAGILSGCPGTLDDPARFTGCPDVPELFVSKCATSGCHTGATPAAKLDLKSAGVESRLAGQPATFCVGGLLANPADPSTSVLYKKLTDSPPCGSSMPLGSGALNDLEMECILGWIGALPAGPSSDAGAGNDADAN